MSKTLAETGLKSDRARRSEWNRLSFRYNAFIVSSCGTSLQVVRMEYDGLEGLFDEGAYSKSQGFDLRRVLASLLF